MMVPANFNETQPNMDNYQTQGYFTQEMVPTSPSPPAFSNFHPLHSPQPPAIGHYVPIQPVQHVFSPNSPNDPNSNFGGAIPPNPSVTVPAMVPFTVPYHKLIQTLQCSNCGHPNHLAGSEISKLESEKEELKKANDVLRKELNHALQRELKSREDFSNKMIPLIQQAVPSANKTLLSPEAKEFICAESKDTNKPEVPVVSAKAV